MTGAGAFTVLAVFDGSPETSTSIALPVPGWATGATCDSGGPAPGEAGGNGGLPPERGPAILAPLGDRFLIAGGRAGCGSEAGDPIGTADRVDPATGDVAEIADVPVDVGAGFRLGTSEGGWTGEIFARSTRSGARCRASRRGTRGPSARRCSIGSTATPSPTEPLWLLDLAVQDGVLLVMGGALRDLSAEPVPVDTPICCDPVGPVPAWAFRPAVGHG